MLNLMIDTETLGLDQDAIILQIGAVLWEDETGYTVAEFDQSISIEDSENEGFTYTDSTLDFWQDIRKKWPSNAVNKLFESDRSCEFVASKFSDWLKSIVDHHNVMIWCSGLLFDIPKVDNFLTKYGHKALTARQPYYNVSDYRTVRAHAKRLLPEKTMDYILCGDGYRAHDALEDCKYQIKVLTMINKLYNNMLYEKFYINC